tara:strand:- start:868 stop:2094 length:1227 start_codon:yes stop_codon:yes gene_type:complete
MIAQVTTPTGIGALTQGMAPQMPPEEVMSTSETISETGIAPLPTPNMPQNFERGGIVGYAPGGIVDPYADARRQFEADKAAGKQRFPKDFMEYARKYNNEPPLTNEQFRENLTPLPTSVFDIMTVSAPGAVGEDMDKKVAEEAQAPVTKAQQSELARDLKNEENSAEARNRKARRDQRKEEVAPSKTMADYVAEFKTSLGDDPLRKKMEERMAKMDERAEKSEKNALFDSMITAGLTMAAGKDQNAINNIAVGALRGVKTYEDALEARDVLDEKQLTLQMQMSKADRAEQIAAIEYGMQSRQFQETQDLKASIAAQSSTIDLMKIKIDGGEFGEKIKKNKADVYKDIIDQDGPAVEAFIEDWFESSGREYDVKDPEFIVAYENFMDKKVADRRGEKGRIPTPGFRLVP